MAKDSAMLIFTDARENNNKFYEVTLNDDDTVLARWGRVGASGQSKIYSGGVYEFNRLINSKTAKGYVRTKTVAVGTAEVPSKTALAETAKRDMLVSLNEKDKKHSVLFDLVEKLSEINRHQIMEVSNGNIKIDANGIITTPLGLVTVSTISEARNLLNKMAVYCQKKDFSNDNYISSLEEYLKRIPQKVPTRRGWYETFFTDFSSLTRQNDFLDQLESSIDIYKTKEKDFIEQAAKAGEVVHKKVFNTQLSVVDDKKVIEKIVKFFEATKNSRHVSNALKLKNVFELHNDEFTQRFEKAAKKIGNVKMLWHGTRAFNVLSILKGGLIIPKGGGSYQITGRMFGDGVYFSDQSTKSLNYSYGYWDGGARDNRCFMFVADVAMGKEYTPSGHGMRSLPKGYDSTFAKAGFSGVQNNEMIVYSLDQVNLRYLCEFST